MEVEQFAAAMDESFPILTDLYVHTFEMGLEPPVTVELPDSFLGRCAPRLQSFVLDGVAFPVLPDLVLSASHFQYLHLLRIPHAGYILPEAMVTFLLPLHNLKDLTIGFSDLESRPHQMNPPPLKHALLPSLTEFEFYGTSEYLLDFIARIDTPMLNSFQVTPTLEFTPNVSQFHKFINRTDRLKTFIQAELYLRSWDVQAIFKSPANPGLDITYESPNWPLSSMMRLCERLLTIPSQVERLKLCGEAWDELDSSIEEGLDDEDQDDPLWLELLNPFVYVKSLYVSKRLGPLVAFSLKKLTGERVTEVLPRLENLFLEGLGSSGLRVCGRNYQVICFCAPVVWSCCSCTMLGTKVGVRVRTIFRWVTISFLQTSRFCFLTVPLDSLSYNHIYNVLHPVIGSGLAHTPTCVVYIYGYLYIAQLIPIPIPSG